MSTAQSSKYGSGRYECGLYHDHDTRVARWSVRSRLRFLLGTGRCEMSLVILVLRRKCPATHSPVCMSFLRRLFERN